MSALPTFERARLAKLIGVVTFGLTALFSVLGLGVAIPATFVVGFFLLLPLVWVLGDDFPLVASESADTEEKAIENPVATLRERYATGEIDDAEFERRLDRLLETEELQSELDRQVGERRTDDSPVGTDEETMTERGR